MLGRGASLHGMDDDPFLTHRSLLFTVAYEVLGSAADAEDVVQETWLRWSEADRSVVRDPRAYLVRIVTRQALNRLRTVARRREDYVGPWLPEPLLTSPDAATDVELAESVSLAMLTVLETLGPAERVVFVLHEVFDTPYAEIAATLGKTPAAVRQIGHRAKAHVAARRPRMKVDRHLQQEVIDRFIAAARGGLVEALTALLAPEIVILTDGGGIAPAARRPIEGPAKVAAFLIGLTRRFPVFSVRAIEVNGAPAVLLDAPGDYPTVLSATVADGLVTGLFVVRNPAKLGRIDAETPLARYPSRALPSGPLLARQG